MPFSFKTIWENIKSFADLVYAGFKTDNHFTGTNTFSGAMYHNIVVVSGGTVTGIDYDKVVILDGGRYKLPTAYHPDGKSKIIFIKNTQTDETTIEVQNNEHIDGSDYYTISGKCGIVVVSDGDSNWFIVGKYVPQS